jgi:hypothetical protein
MPPRRVQGTEEERTQEPVVQPASRFELTNRVMQQKIASPVEPTFGFEESEEDAA